MTKVLILGANGRIARIVEQRLLAETDVQLTTSHFTRTRNGYSR